MVKVLASCNRCPRMCKVMFNKEPEEKTEDLLKGEKEWCPKVKWDILEEK